MSRKLVRRAAFESPPKGWRIPSSHRLFQPPSFSFTHMEWGLVTMSGVQEPSCTVENAGYALLSPDPVTRVTED